MMGSTRQAFPARKDLNMQRMNKKIIVYGRTYDVQVLSTVDGRGTHVVAPGRRRGPA